MWPWRWCRPCSRCMSPRAHLAWRSTLAAAGFLEGRVTYELAAEFRPTADQNPAATPTVVEFARIWRQTPKVVYSRTLERADWNATVVHDVVPAEVIALKAQPGGDLVLGGANVAAEFARHDLIDEYRLLRPSHGDRAWHAGAPAVGREGHVVADRDAHFRQRGRHAALRAASSGTPRWMILVGPLLVQTWRAHNST